MFGAGVLGRGAAGRVPRTASSRILIPVQGDDRDGAGNQLRRRNRALLVGGGMLFAVSIARLFRHFSGTGLVLVLIGTFGFSGALLWLLFLAHRRRVAAASHSGAFGSSSSVHITQLRSVPRFAPVLAGVRKTRFTGGWIGGGVVLDHRGVTWTPTNYSQKRRRVPGLQVPWSDVRSVRPLRNPGVNDPAVLEVRLRDGSRWAMNVSGHRRLRTTLGSLPVLVEPE